MTALFFNAPDARHQVIDAPCSNRTFCVCQTMFAACELGVFDLLQTSGRPLSAGEVAQAVGASLDGTERLLSACTGLELLTAHTQDDGQGHSRLLQHFLLLFIFPATNKHNSNEIGRAHV